MKSRAAVLMLAVAALVPARLAAQDAVDPRWLPWLGCWEPVENMAPSDVADGQVRQAYYCVRPAASGVEIATVIDGASVSSRTMVADGARHPVAEEGCNGWQTAQWSGDGQRLFVSSEVTCEGGVRRTASGLMAMLSPMEWIDAHAMGLGDERVPGAIRYRPAPTSVEESAGFETQTRFAVIADARRLAAAPLSIDDVAEVSENVDGTALQAFLFERGQGFDLNAANIAALSDDGVPDDVIDLMVALSYPNKFALDRANMEGEPMATEPGDRGYDRYGYYGRDRYWDYCYGRGFYSYCSPYSYMPFGWSYGYNPYYYGYGYGYGYGYRYNPVIIVNPNDGYASPGGRAVKGQGYTRTNRGTASGGGSISTGRTAVGRSGASSGSSGGSSGRTAVGRSGGSSGGSSARTSSGGTSTGRTAKARTGGGGGG